MLKFTIIVEVHLMENFFGLLLCYKFSENI